MAFTVPRIALTGPNGAAASGGGNPGEPQLRRRGLDGPSDGVNSWLERCLSVQGREAETGDGHRDFS